MAVMHDRATPAARAILDRFSGLPALVSLTPEQARGGPTPLAAAPEPVASVVERAIPGPGGPLRVRIYRPSEATTATLIYFHGGGWVIGSLDGADDSCRRLANRGRCVVVSVSYRLAPETKFPGAVEDAFAAVEWVAKHATAVGIDASRIAVGGSSAGGSLAAAAALVSRDRHGPKIAFQLLAVPVADLSTRAASHREFADGYGLTKADMEWFGRHYVRTKADIDEPYASVLRADLHDMPPAFVVTAECDPLRDDGEAYAARLREMGVAARAKRYPGMFHGFMNYPEVLPEAREAFADAGAALREVLG
jgi:acetyl esterase